MTMTPDAKRALSTTIRGLRARLLDDLHAASETAYRLSVRAQDAGLDEAARVKRLRLEAWVADQLRMEADAGPKQKGDGPRTPAAFRAEAEKQAAYTLLNRLVLLRLMEAPGPQNPANPTGAPLRAPAVVTGGWESRAYQDFRALAPGLCLDGGRGDATEGYAVLLQLVFEDLATELPGLYGPAGVADLIPVPAATLRHIIDALNDTALDSCWTDDMTLGWVYQYWNDPEREVLDAKINGGGKILPHEIASKTQMFTERYMVDWLLQNSLGPLWLAMCQKNGWTPAAEADGTFATLETRRTDWRARRQLGPDAGGVALTDLMPLHTDAERRWAYYVPQPIPSEAADKAPTTLRDLRLIDPAVGSGHFLVVALDLLVALYREEARHRGLTNDPAWSDAAIVERILGHNLHGIDLDPRAVQIAAAALWLKGRQLAPAARPERLNLVAANLRLASLPESDPALVELRRAVERETGIPARLTDTVVQALRGADHLGSLLKVDRAIDEAIAAWERQIATSAAPTQLRLDGSHPAVQPSIDFKRTQAKKDVLTSLETFLARHTAGDDLGLRLHGEQLAAGVRFLRLVREGTYDLVVANPPYQGTAKMADTKYIEKAYPLGKADLYAAFLLRGLELVRDGGVSAMLTMRNWMFIKQYSGLREHLLAHHGLQALGDFEVGAFEEIGGMVVSVCASIFARELVFTQSIAQKLTLDGHENNASRTMRKRAATLCHEGRHTFDPAALKVVPEWPLVYWWDETMFHAYQSAPLIGNIAPARQGLITGNMTRFLRAPWETMRLSTHQPWQPYLMGAKGKSWLEPLDSLVNWHNSGKEIHLFENLGKQASRPQNQTYYFQQGVAFSMIGANFSARAHRYPSIFGDKGSSVFPSDIASAVCAMNSNRARAILESLNPSVSFQVGDVNRLPLFPIADADTIFAQVEAAFGIHESHREPSVEFQRPGPSPWRHAQDWAQLAVDRPQHPTSAPLPTYIEVLDPEPSTDHVSFAVGVALGRFMHPDAASTRSSHHAEGSKTPTRNPTEPANPAALSSILDPSDPTDPDIAAHLTRALPHGILFLDNTLDAADHRDSLGHPAAALIHTTWAEYGHDITTKRTLREWLSNDFFKDIHRQMYDNRPIHWPLSSAGKTFVAWVNIHRMGPQTLQVLLADHLMPTLGRLDGELGDLRAARDGTDPKAARAAEKRLDRALKAHTELTQFIAAVEQCADKGAPPTDAKCPAREVDARYAPDLDDGVMINSAALWPLLEPQWKDPKKWWKELATASGRKDYDWSHLAMRYWPTRVDKKCQHDPSLGVAHGCFWRYHPARAFAWELRLQDEIGPDFRIKEGPEAPFGDVPHRAAYLKDHADEAIAAIEKEAIRRMGRSKKRRLIETLPLLESGLWTHHAGPLWELELTLSERQGVELRITAPDEPEARAAFEAQNPQRAASRRLLIQNLVPAFETDLFDTADEDADDAPDSGDTDDGEEDDA